MTDTERAVTGLENLRDAILNDYIRETDQAVRTIDDALELLKEHEELKSRHKILVDECDKMYFTLKEKNKTIEELEDDLAMTKDMLNHYLNGNE